MNEGLHKPKTLTLNPKPMPVHVVSAVAVQFTLAYCKVPSHVLHVPHTVLVLMPHACSWYWPGVSVQFVHAVLGLVGRGASG